MCGERHFLLVHPTFGVMALQKSKTAERFVYRLGKTGAREQSPAVDENSRHDHGLEQRNSSTV